MGYPATLLDLANAPDERADLVLARLCKRLQR